MVYAEDFSEEKNASVMPENMTETLSANVGPQLSHGCQARKNTSCDCHDPMLESYALMEWYRVRMTASLFGL